MKFKEIKPGMVIHCPTEENAKELLKHLDKLGYAWNSGSNLLKDTIYNRYKGETCYYIESTGITYGSIGNFQQNEFDITEFPDLLEPELTTEEVLEWLLIHYDDCEYVAAFDNDYGLLELLSEKTPKEIVNGIAQWKADHEKKEPEVEYIWAGKILKIGDDGRYSQVTDSGIFDTGCEYQESAEEYMMDELKEYCKTHEGEYVTKVFRIGRVKRNQDSQEV